MKLKPMSDRVILKAFEPETKKVGGIFLPDSAKEKTGIAEVVAVGPGGLVDGQEVKMTVKVGDRVVAAKYSGTQISLDDVEYTILRQSDILALVEEA